MGANGTWPEIVFAGDAPTGNLSRAVTRGTLRRLARGIYTSAVTEEPAVVVRRNVWRIVAHEFPGAVIADRSVLSGGLPESGALYVVHSRRRPLELPGVVVRPRPGPGPVDGDLGLPDGIWMSSTARALPDNLTTGGTSSGRLGRAEVEQWVDRLLRQRGEEGLTLSFARKYTARIDFTDRNTAEADLNRTNAFRDDREAEAAGDPVGAASMP